MGSSTLITALQTNPAFTDAYMVGITLSFTRPPSFKFLRTPLSGYLLESAVISTLPFVAVDDALIGDHPIHLADPSVAAFIDRTLGNAWQWRARSEPGGQITGTAGLDDLGLTVLDTLELSDEFLNDLVIRKLGDGPALVEPPRQHQLTQQLVAVNS